MSIIVPPLHDNNTYRDIIDDMGARSPTAMTIAELSI